MKTKDFETVKEIIEYVEWCKSEHAEPHFVDYPPFQLLLLSGMVAPFISSIRIMYSGLLDVHYYINERGYLEEMSVNDPQPKDPRTILSRKKWPRGWDVGQLRPAGSHAPIKID